MKLKYNTKIYFFILDSANYCLLIKKLVRACSGDRKPVLDVKYPSLCKLISKENYTTARMSCEAYHNVSQYDAVG